MRRAAGEFSIGTAQQPRPNGDRHTGAVL